MEDAEVRSRINELVREEHELFERESHANVSDADRERLRRIQVTLDQCWDKHASETRRLSRDTRVDPRALVAPTR